MRGGSFSSGTAKVPQRGRGGALHRRRSAEPDGHEQARRLGRLLAPRGVTSVVTSPLARARETAEAIRDAVDCPLEEDERLIEIVPPAQIEDEPEREAEHWSAYMARHAGDREYAVGGAESFAAVMRRVRGVVAFGIAPRRLARRLRALRGLEHRHLDAA
jgi:broad specificity phosphatase PhoE